MSPTARSKAIYALYYAGLACLVPFMSLYYQQRGLNGTQIGILSGLIPLLTLGSAPLWSGIADATRRHRAVLLLAIGGLLLAVVVLFLADSFVTLLAAVVLYALFIGPIVPLVDNAVLDILGERRRDYGRVRVWGSYGWGGAALLLGLILRRAGLSWGFYGFWLFMAGCFIVAARLPMSGGGGGERTSYRAGLGILLGNGRFLLLLFVALVYGVGLGVLLSYQFLYFEDIGASRSLMSLTLTFSTASEIPFWFFGGPLLAKLGSNRLVAVSLVATAVRLFALSLLGVPWAGGGLPSPLLALPVSLLHGPSFALMWSAGVAEADAAAPPGVGATAQGLFSALLQGLGAALGGFVGGPAYEAIGFPRLFAILAAMTLGALLVFVAARLGARARRRD